MTFPAVGPTGRDLAEPGRGREPDNHLPAETGSLPGGTLTPAKLKPSWEHLRHTIWSGKVRRSQRVLSNDCARGRDRDRANASSLDTLPPRGRANPRTGKGSASLKPALRILKCQVYISFHLCLLQRLWASRQKEKPQIHPRMWSQLGLRPRSLASGPQDHVPWGLGNARQAKCLHGARTVWSHVQLHLETEFKCVIISRAEADQANKRLYKSPLEQIFHLIQGKLWHLPSQKLGCLCPAVLQQEKFFKVALLRVFFTLKRTNRRCFSLKG